MRTRTHTACIIAADAATATLSSLIEFFGFEKQRGLAIAVAAALSSTSLLAQGLGGLQQSNGELVPSDVDPNVQATLVVYNQNDRESVDLAFFYASKRKIPTTQMVGLQCSTNEEISRDEYDRTIADPLRKAFTANFWWKLHTDPVHPGMAESNKIRFVALMRGIPLKISATTNYPGDKAIGPPAIASHNEASVDSELAVLAAGHPPISGILNNPYYRSFARIGDINEPDMMLVCRLDAPTATTVRRMIIDSIEAEKRGLHGFAYVDARGITDQGLIEGDQWLFDLSNDARRHGIPVVLDTGPGLFPECYPMRNTAFYFGWYAENVSGPFVRPEFRFEPGAVAVHIHSFSALTLRDPLKNWCGPLLTAGAAATVGNVYEPYLDLTPHLDVLFNRLRSGFTFAESAYMSERVLSWMTTFIGDPLYRPFPVVAPASKGSGDEWAAYAAGADKWFANRKEGIAALEQSGNKLHSGVIFEGLGLLELMANGQDEALSAFRQARKFYKDPADVIRVSVHEIGVLHGMNRAAEALTLAKTEIAEFKGIPSVETLKMIEPQAAPAPPPH